MHDYLAPVRKQEAFVFSIRRSERMHFFGQCCSVFIDVLVCSAVGFLPASLQAKEHVALL